MGVKSAVLPVVAGTIAGLMLAVIGEKIVMSAYMPTGAETFTNTEAAIRWFATLPISAYLLLTTFAGIGALVAGVLTQKLSEEGAKLPIVFTGLLLTLAAIYKLNLVSFQPFAYSLIRVLLVRPLVNAGGKMAPRLPGDNKPNAKQQ